MIEIYEEDVQIATREEMKQEAVRRLKKFDYYEYSLAEFEKFDKVMLNEPPLYAHFCIDEERDGELKKWVDEFEQKYGCLVYAVIHTFGSLCGDEMEFYEMLYVENTKEEWEYFDEDFDDGIVNAYVRNVTFPDYSEIGSIRFRKTVSGGIQRAA